MLSEDYVIRMIQLAVAALLKVTGLRKRGLYDDAQTQIDLGLESLLGLRASRVKALDDERLYFLLTRDDVLDARRLALVSALFEAEGDVIAERYPDRAAESQAAYARALRYALEVFFQEQAQAAQEPGAPEPSLAAPAEEGTGAADIRLEDKGDSDRGGEEGFNEIAVQIVSLLRKVQMEGLGADTLWPLAGYWEETGQYARAVAALEALAARPGVGPEVAGELSAFYRRLLALPAGALAAAGVDGATIREKLERLP